MNKIYGEYKNIPKLGPSQDLNQETEAAPDEPIMDVEPKDVQPVVVTVPLHAEDNIVTDDDTNQGPPDLRRCIQ